MKKKEKSTGAVFIMVIETSQFYFIYVFFFVLAFDLFYKDRFQGNCYNKPRKTYAQDLQPR